MTRSATAGSGPVDERCHHDGLVGAQPTDQSLPRQRPIPTLLGPATTVWREAMPVYNRRPREVPGG